MTTTAQCIIPTTVENNNVCHNYHHRNGCSSRNARVDNLTKLIHVELDLLEESFQEAKRRIDPVIAQIKEARDKFEEILQQGGGEISQMERELRELKQTTSKLKSKIPFNLITPDEYQPASDPNVVFQPPSDPVVDQFVDDSQLVENRRPILEYFSSPFYDRNSAAVQGVYVLWCFLAFPEGAFIKDSLLFSYVNATMIASLDGTFVSFEDIVSTACELVSKGFIKSVYKKHSSTTLDGFWMNPLLRPIIKDCLSRVTRVRPPSLVISVINGEDINYDGSADMSTMSSNLWFLHLGKWQRSTTHHHIEMPNPDLYFKYIGNIPDLAYISFRGVSVMKELPSFITHSRYLRILDLKACHHLEVIPSNIATLWCYLVHLDMSECYFLDHMPVSLSQLTRLRVLKGFFVGETNNNEEECCTLQDLSSLTLLVKLHIYTSLKTFPSENHLTILAQFSRLRNLTICWGGCPTREENRELRRPKKPKTIRHKSLVKRYSDPVVEVKDFSFNLEKLDLRGVPEKGTPTWLQPSNFGKLEKLYIRGGQLSDLRHNQIAYVKEKKGWSVKILRLRHLSKLHMDWDEVRNSFPNVVSMEKVDCPNLTSFPCDKDYGLWTKDTTQPPAD